MKYGVLLFLILMSSSLEANLQENLNDNKFPEQEPLPSTRAIKLPGGGGQLTPIPHEVNPVGLPSTSSTGTYTLTWKDVGAVSYEVWERYNNGNYGRIQVLGRGKNSYKIRNAGNGTYRYRITACNSSDRFYCSHTYSRNISVKIPTYKVSGRLNSTGKGGRISPSTKTVKKGQKATFSLTPNAGHYLVSAKGCGGGISNGKYITGTVHKNCTFIATFYRKSYKVTTTLTSGGSVTPTNPLVKYDTTQTFKVNPKSGYRIIAPTGCNGNYNTTKKTYVTGKIRSSCTVKFRFQREYKVSTEISGLGEVTPTSKYLDAGESYTFDIKTPVGKKAKVLGCNGTLQGDKYLVKNISSNCTVRAVFETQTFTAIEAARIKYGSIMPRSKSVEYNGKASFDLKGDAGYMATSVNGCPGKINIEAQTYTAGPITNTCFINPRFQPFHKIYTDITGQGSVTPTSARQIGSGKKVFNLQPKAGYRIGSVEGCLGILEGDRYTTADRSSTRNCTISITFTKKKYTVLVKSNAGGDVNPGTQLVDHGERASFSVNPLPGFRFSGFSGCGDGQTSENYFSTSPITSNCTISPEFKRFFTIESTASIGGTVSPSTINIDKNTSAEFSISTKVGYEIDNVTGCEGSLSGNRYVTKKLSSACKIKVNFKRKKYSIEVFVDNGEGVVSPQSLLLTHGQSTTFSINANPGYILKDIKGCGGIAINTSTYQVSNITSACSIRANFEKVWKVSATSNTGGNLSFYEDTVVEGRYTFLTVEAAHGYRLESIKGCGGSLSGNIYTTSAVTEDCSINASFILNEVQKRVVFIHNDILGSVIGETDINGNKH